MRIGFIGLGIMGKPMSKNLLKAGYQLRVYNRSHAAFEELRNAGAEIGSSPSDVAASSDVIITMLPNSPQVKEVILGKNGIVEGAKAGLLVIDMSSIAPLVTREISAELAKRDIRMLDAPVSGGEPKAIDGTLSIMVGGAQADFDRMLPVLGRSWVRPRSWSAQLGPAILLNSPIKSLLLSISPRFLKHWC